MMNSRLLALILFGCLTASAGVVVALDCAGGPREQVTYTVSSVSIEGVSATADDANLAETVYLEATSNGVVNVALSDGNFVALEGPK